MQTLQQTMAHRGAGMTRTHARWHPYTPPRSSASNTPNYANIRFVPTPNTAASVSHQDTSYLITPASTVYNISPSTSTFSSSPHTSSGGAPSLKTIPGAKPSTSSKPPFVASLVDQAVKSLTEIWRPEIVPPVFCTSTQVSLADATTPSNQNVHRTALARKPSLQLPSPCSPSTQPSPLPSSGLAQATSFFGHQFGDNTVVTEKELVPIRIYVHEVLRRSRTTCSVLQSALCYIEAIRNKVPDIAELEKSGNHQEELTIEERIEVCEDSKQIESSSSGSDCPTETMSTDTIVPDSVQTVTQDQTASITAQAENECGLKKRKAPSKPLPPLPPSPSPLLCPRRAFLAALILASKFLQDRCYSNRAWAKLSGLAPREVSRCERALGEALEWRLWVGKSAVPAESGGKSMTRTRSESTIMLGSPVTPDAAYHQIPSPPLTDDGASPEIRSSAMTFTPQESLRRAAFGRSQTLPSILANHYGRAAPPPPPLVLPPPACAGLSNIMAQNPILNVSPPIMNPSSMNFTMKASFDDRSATGSMDATEIATPRLSFSPQSLVEPNLDTPSTQYSAAWSPARSTGSNDSSEGLSPPSIVGAYASFSSLDTKVAECMSWRRHHGHVRIHENLHHGFDAVHASGTYFLQPPTLNFGAPSMLDLAPQATGIATFSQE